MTNDSDSIRRKLFFLAVLIEDEYEKIIRELQNEIAARFETHAALKPPVHITLYAPFFLTENRVSDLETMIEKAVVNIKPFSIEAKDFNYFRNSPHPVAYIHVEKNPGLIYLENEVRENMNGFLDLPDKKIKPFKPHITLAYRDFKPEYFETLEAFLKNKQINFTYNVKEFALLKHNGKMWSPEGRFQLS